LKSQITPCHRQAKTAIEDIFKEVTL
jgi:hypothetical protein